MLKHEKIFVNGRAVKASYEIKTNDIVTIIHPLRRIVVRVVSDSEYEIINQSNIENL
ncbi:MAG: RNA-binding S4 domain protein [Pseudothermotoga lettingae]|nr:MAG: RNA-binding S4 domain protein [Pseudothermotoga lettingae]